MRNIPAALKAHLQGSVTTTCRLLRFTLRDGRQFGLTTLDRDVIYLGVTYRAVNGFNTSVIATDTGLSVDNAEAYALLGQDALGITLEMVAAGDMDDSQWMLMLVNYRDLTMGHMIIDAGDVGNITVDNGVAYSPELVSYAMRLRQSIGGYDSRTCRAVFGNPADGQLGCGIDAEALWQPAVVTGVSDDEPRRVFASSSTILNPQPIPGRIRWTSGPNASANRLYQIEAYSTVSGTIALLEPVIFPVEDGHEFDIRYDCAKTLAACKSYGNLINMKAEPFIPTGDGLEGMTPNSQIVGGVLGSEVID